MYNKFIYMIELMKEFNYDEHEMYKEFPFKIKAIIFSSILYVANKYLLKIADLLGLDLVSKSGFPEYYNPFTGEGLGGRSFSWTAALVIDLIKDKGIGIPPD
jgi:hypothetical protein